MAVKKTTYSISEVTIITGKTSAIRVDIDGQKVSISVPAEVKADFDNQFSRATPTALQRKKYATIMRLLRAAFKAGQAHPKK